MNGEEIFSFPYETPFRLIRQLGLASSLLHLILSFPAPLPPPALPIFIHFLKK